MMRPSGLLAALLLAFAAPRHLAAQERGATALGEAVAGLDVTTRVLMIGAHPDDEDTNLITWLARGRQVETAYLSLTRGDGGQNLIGNELGPQLGMIRTEELMAARRLDGGRQFFTRAYDFGFSKTANETFTHWPRDSILRDVVTVVRAFRPHVIVAVFSGTPRDGHGHHQVSGMLAREAYEAAADTAQFPARSTLQLGAWTPSKFYRASRFAPAEATVSFNVGEVSALRGQSYAELASLSRSQHLSQGFGALQRRGALLDHLTLEASRVSKAGRRERSPLEDVVSNWSRFSSANIESDGRAALDSLSIAIAAVRQVENLTAPRAMIAPLARVARLAHVAQRSLRCARASCDAQGTDSDQSTGDLVVSIETLRRRANVALLAASGVLVEVTAPRELLAVGDTMPVTVAVYNQGRDDVRVDSAIVGATKQSHAVVRVGTVLAADSTARATVPFTVARADGPSWMEVGRRGDMFVLPGTGSLAALSMLTGEDRVEATFARVGLTIGGTSVLVDAGPVVHRFADPARGERRRPVIAAPPVSIGFENALEFLRADVPVNRMLRVRLRSSAEQSRLVTVSLRLPEGLTADSLVRRITLAPMGDVALSFRVKGVMRAGTAFVHATAVSSGETYSRGWTAIEYEHIRPLHYYAPATVQLVAVDAKLPKNPRIAYITGVGDNVAPALGQLGLQVTTFAPVDVGSADLSRYGAVVLGPRAFAANATLLTQASRFQAYARGGGTVVVQYGQQEMQTPGLLPYPVTINRVAERVTDEAAPVTLLTPDIWVLQGPNRLSADDFSNWVQERATYMPTTVDPRWRRVLEMHDPGEARNENAVLIAPLGRGAYVYTTLALFRQLPAGVPGAARLFLNLIAAADQPTILNRPAP